MHLLPPDSELWKAFKEGDNHAFSLIYERHIDELLAYGYRITSSRQLIKDSIHDLFLHLWLHRENLADTDSIRYYLFRSLRNRIIQNMGSTREELAPEIADVLDALFAELPAEQIMIEQETVQGQVYVLRSAIEKLPERQQEVIQLRFFHDFSMEQIAALMQINNQSARNLLHRSITQLRGFFEMAGWAILLALALIQKK